MPAFDCSRDSVVCLVLSCIFVVALAWPLRPRDRVVAFASADAEKAVRATLAGDPAGA